MATLLSYGFTTKPKVTTDQTPTQDLKTLGTNELNSLDDGTFLLASCVRLPLPDVPLPPVPQASSLRRSKAAVKRKTGYVRRPTAYAPLSEPPKRSLPIVPDTIVSANPITSDGDSQTSSSLLRTASKSSSDNDRVRRVLKSKGLVGLVTDTIGLNRASEQRSGGSAVSIESTPATMYMKRNLPAQPSSIGLVRASTAARKPHGLTPIEMDIGALEAMANLSDPERNPSRGNRTTLIRARMQKTVRKSSTSASRNSLLLAVELAAPDGSRNLINVITPEASAWQRVLYKSGPITFSVQQVVHRTPLDIIQEMKDSIIPGLGMDRDRLALEEHSIDDLASFLASYGPNFHLPETGLDRYWLSREFTASTRLGQAQHSPAPRSSTALLLDLKPRPLSNASLARPLSSITNPSSGPPIPPLDPHLPGENDFFDPASPPLTTSQPFHLRNLSFTSSLRSQSPSPSSTPPPPPLGLAQGRGSLYSASTAPSPRLAASPVSLSGLSPGSAGTLSSAFVPVPGGTAAGSAARRPIRKAERRSGRSGVKGFLRSAASII